MANIAGIETSMSAFGGLERSVLLLARQPVAERRTDRRGTMNFRIVSDEKTIDEIFKLRYEVYNDPEVNYAKHLHCKDGREWDNYEPMSTYFVAERDGKLVGTTRVVHDSALGLPSDKTYDLSRVRGSVDMVAEITRFVVPKGERFIKVAMGMLKEVWNYAFETIPQIPTYVFAVAPEHADFYNRMGAKIIHKGKTNKTVGAKTVLFRLDLDMTTEQFTKIWKRPHKDSIYQQRMAVNC